MIELFGQLIGMTVGGALGFWYHTVKRFPSQLSLFHFALAIAFLLLGLTSGVETVKVVYTAFASLLILISAVYLIPKENEKSSEDAEVWTNGLTLLMFGTGILTLGMDYANTKPRLDSLIIGVFGAVLLYVFRQRDDRNGRKEGNL